MLKYRISQPDELCDAEIDEMYTLMTRHYENCDFNRFYRDLTDKTAIILLLDAQTRIKGFSSYLVYSSAETKSRILFSGDTVIHKDHWGTPALFYGFGEAIDQTCGSCTSGEEPYWFLISKGIRTYGLMPLFFTEFFPTFSEHKGFFHLKSLAASLASERYGDRYRPETGIIHAGEDFLKEDLAAVPEHKLKNPHIRFFLQANPDYHQGDELACLTSLLRTNIRPTARRFTDNYPAWRV